MHMYVLQGERIEIEGRVDRKLILLMLGVPMWSVWKVQ